MTTDVGASLKIKLNAERVRPVALGAEHYGKSFLMPTENCFGNFSFYWMINDINTLKILSKKEY